MSRINQLHAYKKHLEDSYSRLLEKSSEYRFIDENKRNENWINNINNSDYLILNSNHSFSDKRN